MGEHGAFVAALQTGYRLLLALAEAGVAISINYYLDWPKAAFVEPLAAFAGCPAGNAVGIAPSIVAIGSVRLGFYQGALERWLMIM